jgi:hypothetical protein
VIFNLLHADLDQAQRAPSAAPLAPREPVAWHRSDA